MATLPTIAQTERAVLDAISSYNIRPNEIVPLMGIHAKLQEAGFRADDINAALQSMVDKNWITPASIFIKTTDDGFAAI